MSGHLHTKRFMMATVAITLMMVVSSAIILPQADSADADTGPDYGAVWADGSYKLSANRGSGGSTTLGWSYGGTPPTLVSYTFSLGKVTEPVRNGYLLAGWTYSQDDTSYLIPAVNQSVDYYYNNMDYPSPSGSTLYAYWVEEGGLAEFTPETYEFDVKPGQFVVFFGENLDSISGTPDWMTLMPTDPTRGDAVMWGYAPDSGSYGFEFNGEQDTITVNDNGHAVYFETNGGSWVPQQIVQDGARVTEPDDPVRDGYTFTGWYTDEDCTIPYTFSHQVWSDLTLYAGWEDASQKVTSISISGSSSMKAGHGLTLTATTFPTDADNRHVTWSITSGSNRVTYTTQDTTTGGRIMIAGVSAGSVTVRATADDGSGVYATKMITVNNATHSLYFSGNGGTGLPGTMSQSTSTAVTHTFTIPDTVPTYSGHNFLGWATSPSASTASYQPGDQVTVSANSSVRLYAIWEVISHTVTFKSFGVTVDSQLVEDGGTVSTPSDPSLEGYAFRGWSITPQTPGTVSGTVFDFTTPITSDLTLYARWEGNLHFTSDPSAAMNVTPTSYGTYKFDASPSQYYTTVLWDFGDGTTSTDLSPVHYYSEPGSYIVNLTVYNDIGSDTVEYPLTVAEESEGDGDGFPWTVAVAMALAVVVVAALMVRHIL